MESPVRIYLGAALVVYLLLLSSTAVSGNALPIETTSTTVKDDRPSRYARLNGTAWVPRNKPKNADVALNELNPKDSTSEENTDKNAKYKDRGRVKYNSKLKTSTPSARIRVRTTSTTQPSKVENLIVVTPTPEAKMPPQIIDSMKTYKKTKIPIAVSSSTVTPVSLKTETENVEEEEYEDKEEDEEVFEKYTSSKFHDNNFFTFPSFNNDFSSDSEKTSSDIKVKQDYSSPSFDTFSSFFPSKPDSYNKEDKDDEPFKAESFFDFGSELTTPKNDFFDKKYQEISSSILKNLASIKKKSPPSNATTNVHKIVKENVGVERLSNGTPNNKSTVIIKNTKEIRLLDNEEAGSANKELSDVHGTSIYYEMSVLSTETYAINHSNDDDCDSDKLPSEPTVSTSSEEELAPVKATLPTLLPLATIQSSPDTSPDYVSTLSSNFLPISSSVPSLINSIRPIPTAIQNTLSSTGISSTALSSNFLPISSSAPSLINSIRPIPSSTQNTLSSTGISSTTLSSNFLPIPSSAPSLINSIRPIPSSTQKTLSSTGISSTTLSSNFLPISSSAPSLINSIRPIPTTIQNTLSSTGISSTEKLTKAFTTSLSSRNRNYSKRLNFTGAKGSPNSVTVAADQVTTSHSYRIPQRKFHYTTPKVKPVWMAPRRNITRTFRPSYPSTIYSEHFNIKDKYSTTKQPIRTPLSTVSSDIDPVVQSDVGPKKIVLSPTISDNSIPTLWKRGSTKFSSSTASSTEVETGLSDLEIPPTLTAWALASLRSPPPLASPVVNSTLSTQKTVDENELQKVGEFVDKKEATTTSAIVTTLSVTNTDYVPKKVTEIDQNRLPWKPIAAPITPSSETSSNITIIESKSERLPAESNISNVKSSTQQVSTTETIEMIPTEPATDESMIKTQPSWIPVTTEMEVTTIAEEKQEQLESSETLPSADATKPTGFESITKLPAEITTPQDDTADQDTELNTEVITHIPTTTDYEITTIRFSYVPTEKDSEAPKIDSTTTSWHKIIPTRTKGSTVHVVNTPVTTYRPYYAATTEMLDESTTIMPETSSIEVSPQMIENITSTVTEADTTEMTQQTTTEELTTEVTTTKVVTTTTVMPTTNVLTTTTVVPVETTTQPEETTTIIVEVVTEINTEREKPRTSTTESTETSTESIMEYTERTASIETDALTSEMYDVYSSSEENSGSNEVITQETTKLTPAPTTPITVTMTPTMEPSTELEIRTTISEVSKKTKSTEATTEMFKESTMQNAKLSEATVTEDKDEITVEATTDTTTKSVNDLEDLTSYTELTTEASSRVLSEQESGSGAAVAIAVSTIGVIALILLVGLLLVVRRRGRRGVYAQRCTPVSLDAYSLDSVSVGHRKGNHRLRASKRSYGNPAYDDEVTSHPMQYAALANFAMDIDSIAAEFAEIPSVTVRPDEVPPGCEDKNRYSNVLPLPETRVPLARIGNDPTTEYINANFITGPGNIRNYYIACQAPLPNTVVDFWRMIWEHNSRVIVMLTEYMENGVEKCYEYLPPSEITDNKRTFGEFQIILKKREQRDKYAISSVQFINLNTRTWREVTHLWYFWPAKGVPDDYDSVIDFLSEMRSYMKVSQTAKEYDEEGVEVIYGDQSRSSYGNLSKLRSDDSSSGNGVNVYSPAKAEEQLRRGNVTNGTLSRMKAASEVEGVRPCVVVCASGAGRSGALIALDVCARALAAAAVDVPRVVRELRAQRPHAIANKNHYVFLYKVLSEYGNRLMGGGVDNI